MFVRRTTGVGGLRVVTKRCSHIVLISVGKVHVRTWYPPTFVEIKVSFFNVRRSAPPQPPDAMLKQGGIKKRNTHVAISEVPNIELGGRGVARDLL